MILKLLGGFDVFVAAMLIGHNYLPSKMMLAVAAYLIIKGALFVLSEDFTSYLDVTIGIYAILLSFGFGINIITVISFLFLAQKGLVSLY